MLFSPPPPTKAPSLADDAHFSLAASSHLDAGQNFGHLAFDRGALEKILVAGGPKLDWIDKNEIAESALVDESGLYQFVGFRQHLSHFRNIEMTDVRAEHGA